MINERKNNEYKHRWWFARNRIKTIEQYRNDFYNQLLKDEEIKKHIC